MTLFFKAACSSQDRFSVQHRSVRGIQILHWLTLLCGLFVLGGCDVAQSGMPSTSNPVATTALQLEESRMWMTIGEHRFAITLADTEAARAFVALLPLSINMADLHRNEKYAELPQSLPTNASRPGTIHNGDLMLYGSRTLVVFYLTFSSSYSYTRLGRVDNPSDLAHVLGSNGVHIEFFKD